MGAPGAVTPGVNRFPPVGLTPFSVGDGGAALGDVAVVAVVVVVVVVEGACCPLLPHAEARVHIAISAEARAMATRRRLIRPVNTIHVPFVSIATVDARRFGGRGRRQDRGCKQVAPGGIDAFLRRSRW